MYQSFLDSISGTQWRRIGLKRRAGVAVPLFSIYSKKSVGIGELPDLKLLVDWCQKTGLSIIQLLPLNDVGFAFLPYDAQSGFALEPMYLSLDHLAKANVRPFRGEIEALRRDFPAGQPRVNYGIKARKLGLLWSIFKKNVSKDSAKFNQYRKTNQFWLHDYVLFKVIKEVEGQKKWEDWPLELKERRPDALQAFEGRNREAIRFHEWLQWQLFEQFQKIRKYARNKAIFLMGDLPFLPSRDSSDVWSHPDYFKLDLSSGAPPDAYFFKGQRWGSPPFCWQRMAEKSFDYVLKRLNYAQNFYDCLRLDHVVGFFRLWTIPVTEPMERHGLNGVFDPQEENLWEEHGRKLLSMMVQNTKMLLVAEDLGTVPECSFRVLGEFAIPGTDVQRWMRDPKREYSFKRPEDYRKNSMAVISTHDVASLNGWWEYEAGAVYEPLFERSCQAKNISFEEIKPKLFDLSKSSHQWLHWKDEISSLNALVRALNRAESELGDLKDLYLYSYHEKSRFWEYLGLRGACKEKNSSALAKAALKKISAGGSIFSIQLLQDWFSAADLFQGDSWELRLNFPGIVSEKNWSFVMPLSLEAMKVLRMNREIKKINRESGRI